MILHILITLVTIVAAVLIYLTTSQKMRIVFNNNPPTEISCYVSPYQKPLSAGLNAQIAAHLEVWVEEYGYTQRGVTINDIAALAATNRTYISKYINTTYHCSFKVWVNRLRVERAKELLRDRGMGIEDVAHEVGYSSYTTFMQSFKRHAGCTSSQWRRKQMPPLNCTNGGAISARRSQFPA